MINNQFTPDTTYEAILQQASKQRSFSFNFSKAYPAYIILIITVILSFLAWFLVAQKVKSDRKSAFDKAVISVMNRLELKYQNDYQVLQSMRSLYDSKVQVVRDVFELYGTIPARTYHSIISIMYAPQVPMEKLEEFVYYARSQGYYDYTLHPEGIRNVYYPVEYIVPLEINSHVGGYDLGTDKTLERTILKARDNNIVVSTPIYTIRKPDTSGFFLISPIYGRDARLDNKDDYVNNFEGVLLLELDSKTFFETALGAGVASDTSIVFQCIDIDEGGKKSVVYESENAEILKTNYKAALVDIGKFKVADRFIEVHFSSIPNFGGTFQSILPLLTFIISLMVSFGFSAFILSIISSRARAVDLAERMTRSQRRILESSRDIIAVLDLNGIWKSMNPASNSVFEFTPTEMIGQKIDSLIADPEELAQFYSIINTKQVELTDRLDTQVISKNKALKWISWSLTVSKADELVYCIGRDITLEKIAEEQAALRSKQITLAEQLAREVSEFKTYFMLKLSHQLRNSLTGMMGYLQLLSQKIYDNEEEHDNFIMLAEQSSEELFTFVSDIDDVASSNVEEEVIQLSLVNIEKIVKELDSEIKKDSELATVMDLQILEGKDATMVADYKILKSTLLEVVSALSEGLEACTVKVNAQENHYEGATELQVLTSPNKKIEELIYIYNNNLNSLIDALKYDKKDVLLRFALGASTIRMMNGSFKIESFGNNEGNVVLITLPLNKPQE